jgi:hypothetical protein
MPYPFGRHGHPHTTHNDDSLTTHNDNDITHPSTHPPTHPPTPTRATHSQPTTRTTVPTQATQATHTRNDDSLTPTTINCCASFITTNRRYRARALEQHPDKHMDKPPEELKRIEDGFKLLGEALEVLGDPMKRQLYDEG